MFKAKSLVLFCLPLCFWFAQIDLGHDAIDIGELAPQFWEEKHDSLPGWVSVRKFAALSESTAAGAVLHSSFNLLPRLPPRFDGFCFIFSKTHHMALFIIRVYQ